MCLKDGKNEESKAKAGLLTLGNYEWYCSLLALNINEVYMLALLGLLLNIFETTHFKTYLENLFCSLKNIRASKKVV